MTKPGRNDPCPCGSGQKYKRCCLAKDQQAESAALKAAAEVRAAEAASHEHDHLECDFCGQSVDEEDELTRDSNARPRLKITHREGELSLPLTKRALDQREIPSNTERTLSLVHSELCRRAGFSIDWPRTKKADYLAALTKEIESPGLKGHLPNWHPAKRALTCCGSREQRCRCVVDAGASPKPFRAPRGGSCVPGSP